MKKELLVIIILAVAAGYLNAQSSAADETSAENSQMFMLNDENSLSDLNDEYGVEENVEPVSNDLSGPEPETGNSSSYQKNSLPVSSIEGVESETTTHEKSKVESLLSKLDFSATVDMQVSKDLWDEFGQESKNRFQEYPHAYRQVVDDFWLRAALRMKYRSKYFESAMALRFYPYWTMRKQGVFQQGADLDRYLDVLEINQAYLKVFKEYKAGMNQFTPHFKIGRDGLLTTKSQLFGNYLELPTAGYGETRSSNVVGPFKNRKVFANQMEVGFNFQLGPVVEGQTSIMIGGNVNNKQWYSAPTPAISEKMDSKLSAGFFRGYQDFYFWKKRIHAGGGFRVYTTKIQKTEPVVYINEVGAPETTATTFATDSRYVNGDWTFDVIILEGLKIYSEFGYQRLGVGSSTGIVRPFTAGITIPTGGVLDVLAVEVENVSNTFFSDKSMRDAIGNRKGTKSFAWGIVTEKWLLKEKVGVAWGVYSGSPYGDMKTSFRIISNLK